jgi:hypothetical protein
MLELEVKLIEPTAQGECLCGEPAIRTVVIGQIENDYGSDYAICEKSRCLQNAIENEISSIRETHLHRQDIASAARWDSRNGK